MKKQKRSPGWKKFAIGGAIIALTSFVFFSKPWERKASFPEPKPDRLVEDVSQNPPKYNKKNTVNMKNKHPLLEKQTIRGDRVLRKLKEVYSYESLNCKSITEGENQKQKDQEDEEREIVMQQHRDLLKQIDHLGETGDFYTVLSAAIHFDSLNLGDIFDEDNIITAYDPIMTDPICRLHAVNSFFMSRGIDRALAKLIAEDSSLLGTVYDNVSEIRQRYLVRDMSTHIFSGARVGFFEIYDALPSDELRSKLADSTTEFLTGQVYHCSDLYKDPPLSYVLEEQKNEEPDEETIAAFEYYSMLKVKYMVVVTEAIDRRDFDSIKSLLNKGLLFGGTCGYE